MATTDLYCIHFTNFILYFAENPLHMKTKGVLRPKTRIICTIGPKTNSVEKLEELLDAGMCCVRLNTAHGDFPVRRS